MSRQKYSKASTLTRAVQVFKWIRFAIGENVFVTDHDGCDILVWQARGDDTDSRIPC